MDGSEQTGGPTSTSSGTSSGGLSHLPWSQIPVFRPGETDIHEYSRKLEFLAGLWPGEHIALLAPRAAMMCEGSAFQRVMRIDAAKLKTNSVEGVKALVQALGGIWGKTNLEDRFEKFERAVYTTVQRGDETHESYLARHDHQFESLLSSGVSMEQLRAYVLLRNSGLPSEDKKRLIIDSAGTLEYSEVVKSLKLLGSKFFQEVHAGNKNPSRSRTYDINMAMEDEVYMNPSGSSSHEEPVFVSETDESFIEALAEEGDPDALICQQFEDAVLEVLQNDTETASCYLTYTEARQRLSDRNRNRGFWSPGPSKSNAKGNKGRGKGKFMPRPRRSLASRILESECRRCGQKGHWKAECPLRLSGANSTASGQTKENSTFMTMTMTPEASAVDGSDMIPMDELNVTLPQEDKFWDNGVHDCFMMIDKGDKHESMSQRFRRMSQRLMPKIKQRLMPDRSPQPVPRFAETSNAKDVQSENIFFASHGSYGIVDLGASQSVIGQRQLAQVLNSFEPEIRAQIRETKCDTVFRFGNSSTVHCQKALLIPLGRWFVKLCIVPSDTPFLLSNNMFRTLGAQINTATDRIFLPGVNLSMDLVLTEKKLYLLDFGKLVNMSFKHDAGSQKPNQPRVNNIMLVTNSHEDAVGKAVSQGDNHQPIKTCPLQMLDESMHPTADTKPTAVEFSKTLDPLKTLSNVVVSQCVPDQREPGGPFPPCDGDVSEGPRGTRFHQDDAGRTGTKCDHVWGSQEGSNLREGASGGSELCDLVHHQVCQQSEVPAPPIPVLHSEVCGTGGDHSSDCTAQESSSSQEQSSHDGPPHRGRHSSSGGFRRRELDVGSHRRSTSTDQPTGKPSGTEDQQLGGGDGADCGSTSRPDSSLEGRRGTVESAATPNDSSDLAGQVSSHDDHIMKTEAEECIDVDFFQDCFMSKHMPDNHIRHEMWSYWHERFNVNSLQQVQQHFSRPGIDVLEVYCSQKSQLTQQCLSQGLSAARFSRKHGDLNTITGRHRLYDMLWYLRPKHLWVAPTCKPWCCWSRLNAAKSEALAQRIDQERRSENVHLLLCDALLHLQLWRSNDCHFHLEQPQGSELVHQREMHQVMLHTFRAICDMCHAGKLHHPETGNPLRKRTQVLTTSQIMYHTLEKLQCTGDHVHDAIQGSCKPPGFFRMPLTKYTELYTATFGRKLSRVIQCSLQAQEKQGVPLQSEDSAVLQAIVCAVRNEDSTIKVDEPVGKRRRLGIKSRPEDIFVPDERSKALAETIKVIESQTPRVGKQVFQHGDVIVQVQALFPEMNIKVVESCRGVDRKRELPIPEPAHLMPFRRTFGKDRKEQKIYCDSEWERWDKLSKRPIRRPGIPSKIAITVFASPKVPEVNSSTSSHSLDRVTTAPHERPSVETDRPVKKVRFAEPVIDKSPIDAIELQEEQTVPEELTCPRSPPEQESVPSHGPMFRGLPQPLQQMIAKVHKNLGHPDTRQLQQALKRNGWSDVIIQAVQDFQCDVCFEKSQPKAPRPAHIHAPREFNDLVVFDGVDWSDGQGNKFTFVHFLDTATNFQIAVPFFRQSTEEFMECFRNTWMRWAGAPREVMFDSQTGFNSEQFSRFLQEHSIRSHVIPTGAHWQMGRCERHGGILLRMLDKFHVDQPIANWQDFERALQLLCNAKNSLSRHAGFTPEILVLGKSQHVPGSNTDDTDSAGFLGLDDPSADGSRFAQQVAKREAARIAFIKADHCQALRKAMHARSRPDRMQFAIGDHVMYWRQGKGAEPGSWHGPARIIMLEQPNTVWISHMTRLYRCAPEHVRSVSSREMSQGIESNAGLPDMTSGVVQFRNLHNQTSVPSRSATNPRVDTVMADDRNAHEHEHASEPASSHLGIQPDAEPETISPPNSTSHANNHHEPYFHNPEENNGNPTVTPSLTQAINTPVPDSDDGLIVTMEIDQWEIQGDLLIRHHKRPRLNRFFPTDCSDMPVSPQDISQHRSTEGRYRDGTSFYQTDIWKDNPAAHCSQPDVWTGKTIFQLTNSPTEAINMISQHDVLHNVTSFEILLTTEDLKQCAQKNYKQQEVFLASTAKKQRAEVKMHQLTPQEKELFKKAKIKEIESWLATDTVRKITRSAIPEDQLLRTRWVLTWKSIDAIEQQELGMTKKPKARLVILGFEDPFIDTLERDSPTLGRDSRMLALQVIASHQWQVRSFDIRTAFLRGSRQDGRVLGIEPPDEMRELMGLENQHVCELLKGAYGLINAPLLWYLELKAALLSLNFVMSPFDPCTFVLPKQPSTFHHGEQGEETSGIHGILGVHVDDGIGGGDKVFQEAIAKLEARFPFGNKRHGSFVFTEIQVDQQANGDIVLSQKEYIQDIPSISVSKDRRNQPTAPITKDELQSFRGLIGSLQFAATNTRPDIACKLSLLQAKVSNATVADLLQGNRILEEAKKHSSTSIRIQSIPVPDVHFLSFSDAAFATREKANSQKGCLILATTKHINEVQPAKVSPITWFSKKIARVVASTLASETYALSGALDLLSWTRIHWAWLVEPSLKWQNPEETLASLPKAFAVVDCKSLYDLLQKTSVPQCSEYRTLLEALVIRDRLREGVTVKWVHSAAQMADALTKDMDATTLRNFLLRGRCILYDVEDILKQRSDKKLRNEWYQRSTADGAHCNLCHCHEQQKKIQ